MPHQLIDPDGLRVTVMSRYIEDPRARLIGARHAWFVIEPDDPNQVQCLLRKQGLGGAFSFPMWFGAYAGPNGNLTAAANAPSDNPQTIDPNRQSRQLTPPSSTALSCDPQCGAISPDSQFIVNLLSGGSAYRGNLSYSPVPLFGPGYNSNSFGQGLLNSVGYSGGLGVGNTVGSGAPVPSSNFQR